MPRPFCSRGLALCLAAAVLMLTACVSPPHARTATALRPALSATIPLTTEPTPLRERSRWVLDSWNALPGWGQDRVHEFWPALLRSCAKPAPGWADVCARAQLQMPSDDVEVQFWLMKHLQPYRVESPEGQDQGLITGYYEPELQATRTPQGESRTPLHGVPPDLKSRRPYFTRAQIEGDPALRSRLKAQELMYLQDPLDALVLHIQGSGRVQLQDSDGHTRWLRLAFAGHNDQPYQSVGRWLIERGELRPGEASWPHIKDWARRNPERVTELLWANPRYVFFREEALDDPTIGPRGAQGVPLTPGRSIAVDRQSVPYGTPVWLDATAPLSLAPLQRLVMAQDTGSAITGAVRADFFWGWGEDAEAQAGRMKQPLRYWVLWPRS